MAIENWLDRVERGAHGAAFADAWLRLSALSTADLELVPQDLGPHNEWLLLGLTMKTFGKPIGYFTCAVRDAMAVEERTVIISSPHFSAETNPDLTHATLACLYRLAPSGTELEVVLEDKVSSPTSTLAVAGTYTDAGWGLNPKRTELVSENPRLWIFRFSKN